VPDAGSDRTTVDLGGSRAFQARLHDAGYAGITWPTAYGGGGLTEAEVRAFEAEAQAFLLPTSPFRIGIGMCGPTLLELGTEEQRSRYVRRLLHGEDIWCQLFSEPGAGSDVAGLQTRARREGDRWLLNGQKVWISCAEWANLGMVLARTDPEVPKHRGLTMFILDLTQPGVVVRPLRDMTGGSGFNEVFLDDAVVRDDDVVGTVNGGWHAAVTMLRHERIFIGARLSQGRADLPATRVLAALRAAGRDRDPVSRQRVADLLARESLVRLHGARLDEEARAGIEVGARGSVGKLANAELANLAAEVVAELLPDLVRSWAVDDAGASLWAESLLRAPRYGLAGGTTQVQRTIIGERVLGLPREPAVDRDVPFSELVVGTRRSS
jgi:alkylation response protein AidB-like acyl-CoA dehydrogenase